MAERQRRDARLMTVVETREFQQWAATRMTEPERQEFITFIAGHPEEKSLGSRSTGQKRWCTGHLLLS